MISVLRHRGKNCCYLTSFLLTLIRTKSKSRMGSIIRLPEKVSKNLYTKNIHLCPNTTSFIVKILNTGASPPFHICQALGILPSSFRVLRPLIVRHSIKTRKMGPDFESFLTLDRLGTIGSTTELD